MEHDVIHGMSLQQTSKENANPLCKIIADELLKKYAIFTGGHDRELRQLIVFQDVGSTALPDNTYQSLMHYFSTLPSLNSTIEEFTVVVDRRTSDWNSVKLIINKLNEEFHVRIHHILVLKPQGWLQGIGVDKMLTGMQNMSKIPIYFMNKAQELISFIDRENLTRDLSGDLDFNIEDWITNRVIRQHLHYLIGEYDFQFSAHKIEEFTSKVQDLCIKLRSVQTDILQYELVQKLGDGAGDNAEKDMFSLVDGVNSFTVCEQLSLLSLFSDLETLQVNKLFTYPFLCKWTKQLRCWLDMIEKLETEGFSLRKQLHNPLRDHNADEIPDNSPPKNSGTFGLIDLPVDHVYHIITLDRILINLTDARTQFKCYWKHYVRRAYVLNRIAKIELEYKNLLPLFHMWSKLIASVHGYLPTQPSATSTNHAGKCASVLPTSDNDHNDQTEYQSTPESSSHADSLGDCLSQLDTCEYDPQHRTTILEGLQTLSSSITEAENSSRHMISRFENLKNATKKIIVCAADIIKDNDGTESDKGIIIFDEYTLLNLDLQFTDAINVGNLCGHTSDSLKHHPTNLQTINNNDAICTIPHKPDAAISTIMTDFNDNELLLPSKEFHFPVLKLTSNVNNWYTLFNHLFIMASEELPKAADQIKRLSQLYVEIDNAISWIKEGESLIQPINPISTLNSMNSLQCRVHLENLITFISTRERRLNLLTSPKLFHLKVAGLLDADLKVRLSKLLFKVEDLAERCNHGIALLRQRISRMSFTQTPQSTNSSPKLSELATPKSSIQSSVMQDSAIAPNPVVDNSTTDVTDTISHSASTGTPPAPKNHYYKAWCELVNTEKVYVNFLQAVYDIVWLASLRKSGFAIPKFMYDNQYRLLINWPELLCFHRDTLLPTLEACQANPKKLEQWVHLMVPRLVDLYSIYSAVHENSSQLAEHIEHDRDYSKWIFDCNEEIGRREFAAASAVVTAVPGSGKEEQASVQPTIKPPVRLPFSCLLIKPIQRLQRYHLLFQKLGSQDIVKCDRVYLQAGHKALMELCQTVNVTMLLRGSMLRPSELGKLLLRSDFTVTRDDVRFAPHKQRHVLLFANVLLLTKYHPLYPNHANNIVINRVSLLKDQFSDPSEKLRRSNSHDKETNQRSQLSQSQVQELATNQSVQSKKPTKSTNQNKNVSSGSGTSLSNYILLNNQSGPVYKIKQELHLKQISLTPSVKDDRHRFAIWTANNAHTYVFQCNDTKTRDTWVKTINEILTNQLCRMQEEVVYNHVANRENDGEIDRRITNAKNADRSRSLPIEDQQRKLKPTKHASVFSLPVFTDSSNNNKPD